VYENVDLIQLAQYDIRLWVPVNLRILFKKGVFFTTWVIIDFTR